MGTSYIPDLSYQAELESLVTNVWTTFARPFTLYIEAQKAFISTNPNFSRFGQHDQNVFSPPVTPQYYTVTGTILYGKSQNWDYIEPASRTNYSQDKVRNQFGTVRIKVDATGYALMQQVKLIQLDGFEFKITSTAKPIGLFANQVRFAFFLEKID